MNTNQSIVLKCTLPLLLLTLFFASCNKEEARTTSGYNGFKIDGAVYNMDTLERDSAYTAGALIIRSKDNGGGGVYIWRAGKTWPTADGIYDFAVWDSVYDNRVVRICFERNGTPEQYCSTSVPYLTPALRLTIANGKWAMSLLTTKIIDSSAKILEISASE